VEGVLPVYIQEGEKQCIRQQNEQSRRQSDFRVITRWINNPAWINECVLSVLQESKGMQGRQGIANMRIAPTSLHFSVLITSPSCSCHDLFSSLSMPIIITPEAEQGDTSLGDGQALEQTTRNMRMGVGQEKRARCSCLLNFPHPA
jgi:hypothetical protein